MKTSSSNTANYYTERANQLLALNSLRQLIRRAIPAQILLATCFVLLLGLSVAMYFIAGNAFDAYRNLHLGEGQGMWFILNVYLSATPLVTAILALSFSPTFSQASETIAAMPLSLADWYGPQVQRYAVGISLILTAVWAGVTMSLANIFELSSQSTAVMSVVGLLTNTIAVGLLVTTVSATVYTRSSWIKQLLPIVLVGLMSGIILYIRSHQDSSIQHLSDLILQNPPVTLIASILASSVLGTSTYLILNYQKLRNNSIPLSLDKGSTQAKWLLRLLPMPQNLILKISLTSIRGIILDRKNVAIILSSYLLFACFAGAARMLHAPSLNSLILSTAAIYFPLFLGLVFMFTRSTLGAQGYSIYTKPLSAVQVALGQLLAASLATASLTIIFLLSLLLIVGNHIVAAELLTIALNTACTTAIAYLCGSMLRVNSRDHLSILTGIFAMFILQGSFYSLVGKLRLTLMQDVIFKLLLLALIYLASTGIERYIHARIRTRRA